MSAMDIPADGVDKPATAARTRVPARAYITWIALAMMTTSSVASLRAAPAMAVYGLACVFLYLLPAVVFLLPTSLVTRAARAQARRQDFATSNVRGSRTERFVSGVRISAQYAFGPVAGTAFNLTTVSYNGQLGCGLFVDPAAVGDPAEPRFR